MTAIDQDRIAELLALLGEERLLDLGDQLAAALAGLDDDPPGGLAETLHRLSGSAASLGFPAIAAELAAAEQGPCDLAVLTRHALTIAPGLRSVIHASRHQR